MILGSEMFFDILKQPKLQLHDKMKVIQNTRFGYISSGKISNSMSYNNARLATCYLYMDSVEEQVKKFWEIEENYRHSILSKEEKKCEEHYVANMTQNEEGRYLVKLPFKIFPHELGDSYSIILKRFHHLEKKIRIN